MNPSRTDDGAVCIPPNEKYGRSEFKTMTLEALRASTRKTLAMMARRHGVDGWHSMTKAQLIDALAAIPRLKRRPGGLEVETSGELAVSAKEAARHRQQHANVAATASGRGTPLTAKLPKSLVAEDSAVAVGALRQTKERFVVLVRDAFWLQANWEFRRETICRAQAALGYEWHQARPVIRVLDVTGDETANAAEGLLQEIEIHGGVNHWYIALDGRPRTYRLQIGYRTPSGKFFALARSNVVTPPRPGAPGSFDGHWNEVAQQYERVFSLSNGYADPEIASPVRELFEERLRKPMGAPISHPPAAEKSATGDDLPLSLSAELILYGATHPRARLTMEGEPVALRADGSFVLRMSLPEGRQMLPAVAVSADGMAQRTVIVTIERNTKELEPLALDEV